MSTFDRASWWQRLDAALRRPRWATGYVPFFLVVLAAAVRGWMLVRSKGMLESDEAAFGLLALDILTGRHFPWAFHYGQPYQGVLEGYLLAGLFSLFGATPIVCKLLPLLWSLALVWLVYEVGRFLRGPLFGLLAGLYLAVPPLFLTFMSLKLWFGYLAVTVAGTALVYLVLRWAQCRTTRSVVEETASPAMPPRKSTLRDIGAWALAGALAGVALWTYPLAVPAVAGTVLLLLLLDPRAFLRAEFFGLAVCAALVGALPALLYNVQHNWESFAQLRSASAAPPAGPTMLSLLPYNALVFCGQLAPWPWPVPAPAPFLAYAAGLTGFFPAGTEPAVVRLLPRGVTAVYMAVLLAALAWALGRGLHRTVATRGRGVDGVLAFLLVAALHLTVCLQSGFGSEAQYLLPLYPAVALAFASLACALGRRVPLAAAVLVCFLLGVHLVGHSNSDPRFLFQARHLIAWDQLQPRDQSDVIRELERLGITVGIADYWVGERITFESRRRCLFAWWWHRRYPGWPDPKNHPLFEICGRDRIGWLFHERYRDAEQVSSVQTIEQARALYGPAMVDAASRSIPPYVLYYQRGPTEQRERRAWVVTASDRAEAAEAMTDGDPVRGWSTGGPRQAGDWIAVDCGRPLYVRRIVLLHNRDRETMSGPGIVESSDDGITWQEVGRLEARQDLPATVGEMSPPLAARHWRVSVAEPGPVPWQVQEIYLVIARSAGVDAGIGLDRSPQDGY